MAESIVEVYKEIAKMFLSDIAWGLFYFVIAFLGSWVFLKKFLSKKFRSPLGTPSILFLSMAVAFGVSRNVFPKFIADHAGLRAFFVLVAVVALARIVESVLLGFFDAGYLGSRHLNASLQKLFRVVLRLFVWISFSVVGLDYLGITVTPLLASLGVGSLAVALALQDTLGNVFSGFYILADRPFFVGDWIQVGGDNSQMGQVKKIGWRSCELVTTSGISIVMPNSKISSSTIANFSRPTSDLGVSVECGVSYDSNLTAVEEIFSDALKEFIEARPELCDSSASGMVRFLNFGDSAIGVRATVRAKDYLLAPLVQSELIKTLHHRLRKEGIEIPFPQRVVHSARLNN